MTDFVSKFKLCVLPTQHGKTFTAIEEIETEIAFNNGSKRSIHLIFTMNTILNNSQFVKRLETIEQKYGEGTVCVLSSKKDKTYRHVKNDKELLGEFFDKTTCPRIVAMCSNKKRYSDGVNFIDKISRNDNNISGIFVYYDELHSYINDNVRSQIEYIHELGIVKKIMALTATPDNIFKDTGFWSTIQLIHLTNFNSINYSGCADMVFHNNEDYYEKPYHRPSNRKGGVELENIEFIDHVLTKHPEILGYYTRSFIPGHRVIVTHNKIRELIFTKNDKSVVIMINGKEKNITYNDLSGNKIILDLKTEDCEEVSDTISRLIKKYKLEDLPIVITGYNCVSMGQTLTSEMLGTFTSAIFGHMDISNDSLYQLFGRITGRNKDWNRYTPTNVYCTSVIQKRCMSMEECARNMVNKHNGKEVTREQYREPMCNNEDVMKNIRPQKIKKESKRTNENNFNIRSFDKCNEATVFIKDKFGVNARIENKAAKCLQLNGENPTYDYILNRKWGIDAKCKFRACHTFEDKWCVWWRE
jgi:hypothetical protein